MVTEENLKYRNAFWWITSIAISVLCCSVLFVLFASYLVDLKTDIRDNMMHVNAIEQRQNQILAQLQILAKRVPAATPSLTPTVDAAPITTPALDSATPAATGTETPPASVTVPVMPAASEKQ